MQQSDTVNICDIKEAINTNAERFPWKDNTKKCEEKIGYFVSLIDGKIVYASSSFDVIGITINSNDNHKKESLVGLIGCMYVYDDGTCIPGKRCTCVNGIATEGNKWYVIDRIENNIIRILFR